MTWPDISFVVNKLFQFMHVSSDHHWEMVKLLLRYLNGMRSFSIRLLGDTPQTLYDFSYVDWADNPDDRISTCTFLIFLGANLISWSSTKQRTVARYSIKIEYRAIVATATELQWVKSPLSELLIPMQSLSTLFSNNLMAFISLI